MSMFADGELGKRTIRFYYRDLTTSNIYITSKQSRMYVANINVDDNIAIQEY